MTPRVRKSGMVVIRMSLIVGLGSSVKIPVALKLCLPWSLGSGISKMQSMDMIRAYCC